MDDGYRKLLIWTLLSSFIVLIGIGHGLVPIILPEIFTFIAFKFQFTFNEDPLAVAKTASLFFLIGQVFLLFCIVKKRSFLFWIGIAFLWFGFYILIHGEGGILIIYGLPFAILSFISVIKFIISMSARYEGQK